MFDGLDQSPATLACGRFRLDPARRELLDQLGRPVRLRSRSFDLLHALLRRAGRVVSRAELLDAVWGEVHVTDDSVTQCVVEIRRALGPASGVTLRTVPRHGYMLEAPAAAPRIPALAVLPFANLAAPGDARVLQAVAGDLMVELARQGGLRVLAGAGGAAPHLLEGSLRRAGPRLRLTAQLVESDSATLLWAERFDCEAGEDGPLPIQDAAVAAIAGAVRRVLAGP